MNRVININKRTKKAWSIGVVVRSWLFKRIMLNIVWFIINLIGLIAVSVIMNKYFPNWILLWYALVFIYGISYRLISMIIFDVLIGDEWS